MDSNFLNKTLWIAGTLLLLSALGMNFQLPFGFIWDVNDPIYRDHQLKETGQPKNGDDAKEQSSVDKAKTQNTKAAALLSSGAGVGRTNEASRINQDW